MKYPNVTLGRVEAVWNKLGGEEGVNRFLRGELTVTEPIRCWREQDGVISFSVTSDNTTGPEWIKHFEKKGLRVSDYAKSLLCSSDFKPTKDVTTEIVLLKGMLFTGNERLTNNIRAEADKRKLAKPNAEVACLIREKFTDEEIQAMGLRWVIVMHEPIKDSGGDPCLLDVDRGGGNGCWLHAYYDEPGSSWGRDFGFAFVASQSQG